MLKKSNFYIFLSLLISGSIQALYKETDPNKVKPLVKEAWQEAYKGNTTQAEVLLKQAAEKENLPACLYLAHSYEHGSLLVEKNPEAATYFNRHAEKLKQELQARYLEKKRQSSFCLGTPEQEAERSYNWDLEKLKRSITKKDERLESIACAQQDAMYQQAMQLVQQASASSFRKNTKIPSIQQTAKKLFDLFRTNGLQDAHIPLLECTINKADTGTFEQFLAAMNANTISIEKRRILLPLLHPLALAQGKQSLLEKAYHTYIWDNASDALYFNSDQSREEQEQTHSNILDALAVYHTLNAEDASGMLDRFLERKIEHFYGIYLSSAPDESLIRYLTLAQQISKPVFNKYAEQILSTKFSDILGLALVRPELMSGLEGTSLALNELIAKAFEQLDGNALKTFLRHGQAFHELYQERLVKILPAFLQQHPYSEDHVTKLMESPLPLVRYHAFLAIVGHLALIGKKCDFHIPHAMKDLLKANLEQVLPQGTKVDAYRYMYYIYRQHDCIPCIQSLWLHLAQSNAEEDMQLLAKTLTNFFGITCPNSTSLTFEQMLNDTLMRVVDSDHISFDRVREFLMHANDTQLSSLIHPSFHEACKNRSVFCIATPLKERCQFLSDLICTRLQQSQGLQDVNERIAALPEDDEFKEYAQTVIATVQPTQTYHQYFANRRKIKTFAARNDAFDGVPPIIRSLSLGLYNALGLYRLHESNQIHISVEDSLDNAQLKDGLLFGYVMNDNDHQYHEENRYRFYACDPQDGDAIWATPFTTKKPRPFVVTDHEVYCATDDHKVIAFDKQNGAFKGTVVTGIGIDEEISYLTMTKNKVLFVVNKTKVQVINVAQQTAAVIEDISPHTLRHKTIGLIGNRMAFRPVTNGGIHEKIVLIDEKGKRQEIFFDSPEEHYTPTIWGNEYELYYTQRSGDTQKITCVFLNTGAKLWEYTLPEGLGATPQFLNQSSIIKSRLAQFFNPSSSARSYQSNLLFLLTKKELIALDPNPGLNETERTIWKTSIVDNSGIFTSDEINKIAVTNNSIYGLNTSSDKSLLKFDCQTGAKETLYKIDMGRARRLLGTFNNNIYIQPYSH